MDISRRDLARNISFVFQDSRLLAASIAENVSMGKLSATRREVEDALRRAQCDDIIAKLPDGMDTVVGSKGVYLSGGEAQRIAIARQILKGSPIVILDEATAFADPDNEQRIRAALAEVTKGKTVITIAHRLEGMPSADRVYLLSEGSVVEAGTHDELLRRGGAYAALWREYNRAANYKLGGNEK